MVMAVMMRTLACGFGSREDADEHADEADADLVSDLYCTFVFTPSPCCRMASQGRETRSPAMRWATVLFATLMACAVITMMLNLSDEQPNLTESLSG